MKKSTRQIGSYGELLAERFLKNKKYKILEKNFYTLWGEIDLIAKDKKELVFVEVKLKNRPEFGLPEDEFNFYKKQKMVRAIKKYFLEKGIQSNNWRIDLIAIQIQNNQKPEIHHYSGIDLNIRGC